MPSPPCSSILYIDDDAHIREVVRAALSLISDMVVHTADSGERAIDLAYELRPDLILMDIMMPGLDGPATFRRLRASPLIREIPVIFLTAKVLPGEVAEFLELGAIGIIAKPFDPLDLGNALIRLWREMQTPAGARKQQQRPPSPANRINSLANAFLQRTRRDLRRLGVILADPQAGDGALLKEIEAIAHSIRGAGPMFGFPRLGTAGGAIERTVAELLAIAIPSPTSFADGIRKLRDCAEHLAVELGAAVVATPRGLEISDE